MSGLGKLGFGKLGHIKLGQVSSGQIRSGQVRSGPKVEELFQNLNEVILGQGHRIVLNQLKITNSSTNITLQEKERIAKNLLITGDHHG